MAFFAIVAANWHPLTIFSYALDYAFFGLDPMGYHLTNIAFHTINTFLVFLLTYRLTASAREERKRRQRS